MNAAMQTFAKRCFYRARRSATLRRVVAFPIVSGVANAVCRRILRPPGDYPAWIADRLLVRRGRYPARGQSGLLSFITTVWNTPVAYLHEACDSLLHNQTVKEFEWVLLDNGSTSQQTRDYLPAHAATDPRVKFIRVEKNLGIIGGMRVALEAASGRYVIPYDSDDTLYPDAVEIITHFIRTNDYPAALYSDEDKLDAGRVCWPYFKPDWDPVLFVNSCYVAHLGCFDRKLAVQLDAYGDKTREGCHDWDTFLRLMLAGHTPVHIPEMLYSWRMHANSTAGNINSKSYIHDSHRSLLTAFLNTRPDPHRWELKKSPLFNNTPDWWFSRRPVAAQPLLSLVLSLDPNGDGTAAHLASTEYPMHEAVAVSARGRPREILHALRGRTGLVCITFDSVRMTEPGWAWEALSVTELHPDTVLIAGRVINPHGRVTDATRVPGFGGLFGCPDRGRDAADPGHSAEMWKQRSAGGASTLLCVFDVNFLTGVITAFDHQPISWFFLGAWASALARRSGKRIVYTPFLAGESAFDVDPGVGREELAAYAGECGDVLRDTRFYSRHFGLNPGQAYEPVSEPARASAESGRPGTVVFQTP
jgi:glycosyltransferase involved in cell wall biosynthesis